MQFASLFFMAKLMAKLIVLLRYDIQNILYFAVRKTL